MTGAGPSGGTNRSVPKTRLPVHNLTRYLKVTVEVDDGVMRWDVPVSIEGIVPIGRRVIEVPVENVATLEVGKVVHPLRLAVAVAVLALAFLTGSWWIIVPGVIIALWIIVVAFGPNLIATTTSGDREAAAICFGHQIDAEFYRDAVLAIAEESRP